MFFNFTFIGGGPVRVLGVWAEVNLSRGAGSAFCHDAQRGALILVEWFVRRIVVVFRGSSDVSVIRRNLVGRLCASVEDT